MNRRTVITFEARQEIAEAIEWYERQNAGVGIKFWVSFKTMIQLIKKFSELYRAFGKRNVRRAPMRKFPYAIFHRVKDDELRILGVVPGAINPEKIIKRFN